MNHLPLIIKREYLTKVRNKSFIIMTILSPIIMIALIAVVAYLSQLNNSKERTISILDESGMVESIFKNTENTNYVILNDVSIDDAKKQVEEKEQYGLLHISKGESIDDVLDGIKFYSKDTPSITLMEGLESKLERKFTDLKLQEQGVDIEKLKSSEARISIAQESFLGEKSSKIDNVVKLIFGGFAGYMLFMFIIIYGNMIMRSVIEEKTSRIIEVIISSVKPVQLMLGKIIGTSLAGITQFIIWIILGGILMMVVSAIFGINMAEMQAPQQELMQQAMETQGTDMKIQSLISSIYNLPLTNLVIMFLLFFIGGYLLYSSLYAAIGAAVDNETDTHQFILPILLPLILTSVQLTLFSFDGTTIEQSKFELAIVVSYDVIMLTVSYMLFDFIWKD